MKNLICLSLCLFLLSCEQSQPTNSTVDNERWWTEEDRQFILSELDRTTQELDTEIKALSEQQWNFREDSSRWSIAEIIEHLEIQNQLHFREISVTANGPQYIKYRSITKGQDQHFIKYATDATPGQSQWFMEPLGRFPDKEDAWEAFSRARGGLRGFVQQTPIDLRRQFTFRTPMEGKAVSDIKIGQVRDLHQLLLTGIAHTDRHLSQIRKIKEHENYPE